MSIIKTIFNSYFKINPLWIILSILIGFIIYFLIRLFRPKLPKDQKIVIPLLISYIFLMLSYLVFSRHGTGIYKYELNPFWSYKFILVDKHIFLSAVLNTILYIPIGFLLPVKTKSYRKAIIIGFFISWVINLLQLITTTGKFEFDDIFHNTIGICIGCWLLHKFRRFIAWRIRINRHRK